MLLRVLLLGVCAASVSCTGPNATISDPRPYTLELMLLANAQVPPSFQSGEGMQRYFGQTPAAYDTSSLRLDRMLDTSQRASAFSQVSTASTAIKLSVAAATQPAKDDAQDDKDSTDTADTTDPNAGTGGNGAAATGDETGEAKPDAGKQDAKPTTRPSIQEQFAELRQAGQFIVADSPFDALDRVDDFYASAVLKFLRKGQDPRSAQVSSKDMWAFYRDAMLQAHLNALRSAGKTDDEIKAQAEQIGKSIDARKPFFDALSTGPYREYVLFQQATVEPGNADNQMVGVRVKIIKVDGKPISEENDVCISRVHPARAYDLEPTTYLEDLSVSLALAGDIPVSQVANVAADRQASLKAEAKRQFISRLGKHGGVIDAANKTYGWDFYPTNLRVERKNILGLLFGLIVGTPQLYDVKARLEPGGRDAAVWLLVPRGAKTITCQRWTVAGPVDGPGNIKQVGQKTEFTVRLQADRKDDDLESSETQRP